MKISDRAKIAEGFQSSINIDFDMNNPDIIAGYVPTSDVCDVFGAFLKSLTENKNQASFLVGPYGKGKSFLTLALLHVACGKASKEAQEVFVRKVEGINPVLAKDIQEFIARKQFFLPVVVNSDYDNLKQSFMVALKGALDYAGLTDLVPASSFDSCREILKSWRLDPTIAQGRLASCGKQYDLATLDEGLKNYSPSAYESFVDLYNCVTIGQRFNPLVNEDVPKLFADVSAELKKCGFAGLVVVFDEFSKFLESKSKKLGEDLKFIQDFAEKATRSDSHYSLHLCCIAHKPIGQYGEKNSKISDLLKTVEGRFVTLRFQRGMKENMELISHAIQKQPGFDEFYSGLKVKYSWLFDGVNNLHLLDPTEDFDSFAYGCYPLNPLAAYLLVRVSELVAQNERTLFTFINGNDATGLRKLIQQSDENMIGVPAIFDYFAELFRGDSNQHIKDVCYLADAALKEQTNSFATEVVKSLAVIRIVNDPRSIRPTRKTLSYSIGIDEITLDPVFDSLLRAGIIRESETEETIDFSFAGSKEINEKAEQLLSKELRRVKPIEYLNMLCSSDFYLPRGYNAQNRIVRYCRYCYLDYSSFAEMLSFDGLGQLPYDVLIVRLVGEDFDWNAIEEKVKSINNPKVIVEVPAEYNHLTLVKLLRYYAAYKKMSSTSERGERGAEAVSFITDECQREIRNILNDAFGKGKSRLAYCSDEVKGDLSASVLINQVFDLLYKESPLINNEMLNRNVVTSQYRKTRNDVVTFLLSHGNDERNWSSIYSETSAQNTIWRVFVQNIDTPECRIRPVVDLIKKRLNVEATFISVKSIVEEIAEAPYGIRSGVIPLFFAVAISELNRFADSSITLYFRQKEIELDASNLEKAVQDVGRNYCFVINTGAQERGKYISLLIALFGGKAQVEATRNAQQALHLFTAWFRNLPEIVRSATNAEYPNSISQKEETFLRKLSKFDLNPTEFLFDFLPGLFAKEQSLSRDVKEIAEMKASLEMKTDTIAQNEFLDLGPRLGFGRGSLLAGFKGFLNQKRYHSGDLFGNKAYCDLADYFVKSNAYDDASLIKEISPILLGQYFEDWSRGSKVLFVSRLEGWKAFVETSYAEENRTQFLELVDTVGSLNENHSPMTPLLESSIRSAISQFGQSVSEEDIKFVLIEILKNMGVGK